MKNEREVTSYTAAAAAAKSLQLCPTLCDPKNYRKAHAAVNTQHNQK